ncbi:hypothetical protein G3I40_00480 [Streptomyces sp. SID14478]|nr:hypothetical protein [Streptomyces sp. SID14478]NEB73730.1 hypothetical protein [Streptomyces sp. SID14478]
MPEGDGVLRTGRLLQLAQAWPNASGVFRLDVACTRGAAVARLTDP